MDTQDVARRILRQRMSRFADSGPSLGALGTARYRVEERRLKVAYATIARGQASTAVAVVLRYARVHGMQVQWTVVPTRAGEEELPAALCAAGFAVIEDLLLMVHKGSVAAPPRPNLDVRVTRMGSWQAMWEYEYGSQQSFYSTPRPSDALVNQRATERWHEQERGWCRYYAALLGGRPVGGCYGSLYEDIPTLMGVYTLPTARRRGIAGMLVAHAINDLITAYNDLCCLFVERDNPAERLYRSLGFVPLLHSQTHALGPAL